MGRYIFVLTAALWAVISHPLAAQPPVADAHSLPRNAVHPVDVREVPDSRERTHAQSDSVQAELLWVMDGDSLRARVAGKQVEVRLADIDAPEHGQRYAWDAKLALIDLVRGKRLSLAPREVDRHGRIVARVWAGEMDLSRELVDQGAAWFYPAYAKDNTLLEHEQRARDARRGLWGVEGRPLAPWVWRKRQSYSTFPRNTPPASEEHGATER